MTKDQARAIKAEYDATYARDQLTTVTEAARAMLAALEDLMADHVIKPHLIAGGYLGQVSAAIAQAEAAGIGEK